MNKEEAQRLARVEEKIDAIDKKLDSFIDSADHRYAPYATFKIVKNVVFGFVGMVLTTVSAAIISLVVRQ